MICRSMISATVLACDCRWQTSRRSVALASALREARDTDREEQNEQ
jgi:hypothetical protein